jgi:hypothetical protein
MLTRDIHLQDTLLDLLDNCIDGAVRTNPDPDNQDQPYEGFGAQLSFSSTEFSLSDNCGGIPIGTARNRAFRLGRPPAAEDDAVDGKTVGVYGIGMKRAVFKLGRDATVTSNGDDPFQVKIGATWLDADDWQPLELSAYQPKEEEPQGTTIHVAQLYDEVAKDLGSKDWIERFRRYVASHYALIIAKGFEVTILSEGVSPKPIRSSEFALAATGELGGGGVQPFIYRGEIGGVNVEILAGLLKKPLNAEEIAEVEGEHAEKSLAGWTVACNDRVVVSLDRTHLTGWGTGGVSSYHGQYSVIAGIVLLYADDVQKLPLTTTKRGLDGSSAVYAQALDIMREATKKLTAFTNAYKTDKVRKEILDDAPKRTLAELRSFQDLRTVQKGKLEGFQVLTPELPKPARTPRKPRVSFDVTTAEVQALKDFLEIEDGGNNDVGRAAFEFTLDTAGFKDK